MRSFLLLAIAGIGLSLAAQPHARAQTTAEILPLNTMVTVNAPGEPVTRKTAFKKILRYCSFESQNVPDYVKVFRFQVTPGQKYTLYDCHPASTTSRSGSCTTRVRVRIRSFSAMGADPC